MLAPNKADHNVIYHDQGPPADDHQSEVLAGLKRNNKSINPKYFYDARGSALFEQITELPEYYPTRTEQHIYRQFAQQMADYCGKDCVLIEPGCGSCEKVRLLLDSLKPSAYVPLDISAEFLRQAARDLGRDYPWLNIHAVCADFSRDWQLPEAVGQGRRVVFYPGSTIGNLEPQTARRFLSALRHHIGPDGGVLVGVDLHKDHERLTSAYNDSQGVTAKFNLNMLHHINRLLGADFDPDSFSHRAFYDPRNQRIEMHLVSREAQSVQINGSSIHFGAGETIHTENSYKYTVEDFARLAADAGYQTRAHWLDEEALFSVHYLTPRQ